MHRKPRPPKTRGPVVVRSVRRSSRRTTSAALRYFAPVLVVAAALLTAMAGGCGANAADLAYQAGSSTLNTFFDLFLTGFANQVADSFDDDSKEGPGDDDASGGDDDGGTDDGGTDDGGTDDGGGDDGDGDGGDDGGGPVVPDGDAAEGEATFLAAGCTACHGEAGEGGAGPALFGMNKLAALEQRFGGGASHMGLTLSEQEIVDVATWLLGEQEVPDGDGGGGDSAAGEAFLASNCAGCHGADGASGFAPDITGSSADELRAGVASPVHGGLSLTDQEAADLAAFLGG